MTRLTRSGSTRSGLRRPGLRRSLPTDASLRLPGDDIIPNAPVVMDRLLELDAPPDQVWPWLLQLGKRRAGWYMPASVERLIPRSRRSIRYIEPRWQRLAVGDAIPDWGPGDPTFVAEVIDPHRALVYRSERPRRERRLRGGHGTAPRPPMVFSWALILTPTTDGSRLHIRLRMNGLLSRFPRVAESFGGLVDLLTIMLLDRGLRERLATAAESRPTGG